MALAWSLTAKIPGSPTAAEIGPMPSDIAKAIAEASLEKPLFSGVSSDPDSAARMSAATMTGISRYESGNRQVPGDCKGLEPGDPDCGNDAKLRARGKDPAQHPPQSFCFMQVHLPDGKKTAEGWTGAELMADPLKCARAAREIIRKSMLASPGGQPLLQYAGRAKEAKTRWDLVQKLYKLVPVVPIKCDD